MIDESLARTARKTLFEVGGDFWDRVEWDIQDDGTYLLLMARIAWGEPKEVSPELKRRAVSALNALIPPHPPQELGSWMLNVYYGEALIDSILPDEL